MALRNDVARFLAGQLGCNVRLLAFEKMPDGHAGSTFGIELEMPEVSRCAYVLKMAPAGVRRSGSTDIYRQVPLLLALQASGMPVPAIRWSSSGDEPLGAPFIIMECLPGRTFLIWDPHPDFAESENVPDLWFQTARALASVHRFVWQDALGGWDRPASLIQELDRWSRLLRHTQHPEWIELAKKLLRRLRATKPSHRHLGLVHGDFQPGNLLFEGGRLTGIVDWDLAMIGPQGIDVGWLMMMADRDCWEPGWQPQSPPAKAELLAAYGTAGGPAVDDPGWYQAFAHFRMGAIAGLNLKLHRDGRRIDPVWERFAPSIPRLLTTASSLI